MQVEHHRSAARGVTSLMYVGDVTELDTATSSAKWWLVAGGLFLAGWLLGKQNRRSR